MQVQDDSALYLHEKIHLIKAIEGMQKHRWARLRRFHSFDHISMSVRHLFMQKEIDLLRNQKMRLLKLKQEVLQ